LSLTLPRLTEVYQQVLSVYQATGFVCLSTGFVCLSTVLSVYQATLLFTSVLIKKYIIKGGASL
jgi:hypothetical protein